MVVRAIDQVGNTLPYLSEGIQIETFGDIEVIGPKQLALTGGSIAFWIRTKIESREGIAKIKVNSYGGYKEEISIELEKRA